MKSGHPWKLNKIVNGQPPAYPYTEITALPEGYTWNDISYVIGGYNWKARFMDQNGHIITDRPGATISDTTYLNQYNFANPAIGFDKFTWSTYNSGKPELKYTCGACHTTGYSAQGNQDNLPGIVGTWAESGIQCEACHGPGSLHMTNPRGIAMQIDRDPEACGECHIRSAIETVDAKGGFIEHHEQYEELFQSKHITLNCVTCHDPHTGVVQLRQAGEQATRTTCSNCHWREAQYQDSIVHPKIAQCQDCHMPRIVKSALGNAEAFTGDIRTHLMAIDPNQISQFSTDGKTTLSQIGLDFACRNCHYSGGKALAKTDEDLMTKANGYHTLPPPTPAPTAAPAAEPTAATP
jgi:hypothetical protein